MQLAAELLAAPVAVDIGGVEERDARRRPPPRASRSASSRRDRAPVGAELPGAEADHADARGRAARSPLLHLGHPFTSRRGASGQNAAHERTRTAAQPSRRCAPPASPRRRSAASAAPTSGSSSGESALIASAELEPAGDVPALDELPEPSDPARARPLRGDQAQRRPRDDDGAAAARSRCVEARDGRSFLDIIIGQTLALRAALRRPAAAGPDGQRGDAARDARGARGASASSRVDGLPLGLPAEHDPEARGRDARAGELAARRRRSSGARPGHGDVYGALRRSGMLAALLERGFRLRDDLQLRQPRRDARPADRRAHRGARRSRS